MKNTPLSKLRRKSKSYFRKIGVVTKGRRKRSTIEYIVRKTYEALPKNLKEYLDNPEQMISAVSNIIIQQGETAQVKPYEALKQAAEYMKKKSGDNTRQFVWNRFRLEEPTLYAKFNSYMYRQGYSARNYWFENVGIRTEKSWIETVCELPIRDTGVQYTVLEINYDFSGQVLQAYLY